MGLPPSHTCHHLQHTPVSPPTYPCTHSAAMHLSRPWPSHYPTAYLPSHVLHVPHLPLHTHFAIPSLYHFHAAFVAVSLHDLPVPPHSLNTYTKDSTLAAFPNSPTPTLRHMWTLWIYLWASGGGEECAPAHAHHLPRTPRACPPCHTHTLQWRAFPTALIAPRLPHALHTTPTTLGSGSALGPACPIICANAASPAGTACLPASAQVCYLFCILKGRACMPGASSLLLSGCHAQFQLPKTLARRCVCIFPAGASCTWVPHRRWVLDYYRQPTQTLFLAKLQAAPYQEQNSPQTRALHFLGFGLATRTNCTALSLATSARACPHRLPTYLLVVGGSSLPARHHHPPGTILLPLAPFTTATWFWDVVGR